MYLSDMEEFATYFAYCSVIITRGKPEDLKHMKLFWTAFSFARMARRGSESVTSIFLSPESS